ncbi:hypothetical protein CAPTEDRAFT_210087 [Capitella teleta]|uniref:Uncharacterized protein n=1 Tax=Capitella teleta TaxID=283909 RepID=R7TJ90_CAPTE|nr:hypothetical protein CAPTEDRAFT_210087 [Capitella teleta]|eukprot:ELT93868.1 hypothetical protein CAPTEDRAFT_210087 [Capitella teleta]
MNKCVMIVERRHLAFPSFGFDSRFQQENIVRFIIFRLFFIVNESTQAGLLHYYYQTIIARSRFVTDQEPVKSRRESERRPTQEMTGDLKRVGRLAIRHSNSHRSNRNKNMERGGVLHLSTLKIMTLTGLDLCRESSRWTCRCPQHIQPRKEKDLEEDASFHRPASVMSEDED